MIRLLILASLGATILVSSKNVDNSAHNLGALFGVHRGAAISNLPNRGYNLGWLFGVDRKAATEQGEESTVCNTDECNLIAKVMKESMNESVDPCDDFYEYACGKWAANNPLAKDERELSLWNMVQDKVANQVKEMIDTPIKRDDVLAVKLGKNWYKTCMDRDRMNKRGVEPVLSTIWGFGGWPLIMEENEWDDETYTWQKVDNYYSHLIAHNVFYDVLVGRFSWEDEDPITVIIPPDLPHKTYKLWKRKYGGIEEEGEEGSQERGSEEKNDDIPDESDSGDDDDSDSDDDDEDNEVEDSNEEDLKNKRVAKRKTRMGHRIQKNRKHKVSAKQNSEGRMKKRIKRRATKAKIHTRKERKQRKIIKKKIHRSEAKAKEESSKIDQTPAAKRIHLPAKKAKLSKTHKLSSHKHIHVTQKKHRVGVESYDHGNDKIIIDDDIKVSRIAMNQKSNDSDDAENGSGDEGDDEENDDEDSGSNNNKGDSEDDEDNKSDGDDESAEDDDNDEDDDSDEEYEEEEELDPEAVEKYSKYILTVALALSEARGVEISPERMNEKINDMIQFLIKLKTIIDAADPDFDNTTLAELQETYDSYEPKTSNGKINWVKKIERFFAAAGVEIDENFSIIMGCPRYIKELRSLLDETPSETIVNYMHWAYISVMIRATTDEMRDLYAEWDNGEKETDKSWSKSCTEEVEMTNTIGYEYVRKYFSEDVARMARDMIDDIQKEVEYQIKESTWMDEETKDFILDKLVNMERLIGYPSWYENATLVKRHFKGLTLGKSYYDNILYYSRYLGWKRLRQILNDPQDKDDSYSADFDPLMLNAFFIPDENSIAITAVDFQSPFFAHKRPRSINYGIIGLIMAHEVNHGFDDSGHLYNKNGKVMEWLSAMAAAYNKRAECFVDQFDRYSLLKSENFTVEHYGNKTAGENIADTMGLQAVFRAYKRRERECENPDLPLPGLEKFDNDQLFFLSFANLWCENVSRERIMLAAKYDVHSTGRLRVIGSVSNSPDFAKAYNCPAGSPMNPVKKCNIWK